MTIAAEPSPTRPSQTGDQVCGHLHAGHDNAGHARSHLPAGPVFGGYPAAGSNVPTGRARSLAVATGLLGATALTYVIVHDPTNGSIIPPCPLREATGIWCPGCGLTRAVHALGNGDPVKAFKLNLFVLPVMMSFGLLYGSWALRAFGVRVGNPGEWFARRHWLVAGTIALMVVFSIVRNLPGFEFLIGQ